MEVLLGGQKELLKSRISSFFSLGSFQIKSGIIPIFSIITNSILELCRLSISEQYISVEQPMIARLHRLGIHRNEPGTHSNSCGRTNDCIDGIDTTYETEVNDFFDIDRHVGVLRF